LLTQYDGETNHSITQMPTVGPWLLKQFQLLPLSSNVAEYLSPREQEVLELLAAGRFYRDVGKKRGIGLETVRTHVKTICSKMRVRNQNEAVAKHSPAGGQKRTKPVE
jgi:DNA-binding NarL/FixJ family response regulator